MDLIPIDIFDVRENVANITVVIKLEVHIPCLVTISQTTQDIHLDLFWASVKAIKWCLYFLNIGSQCS